MAKSTLKIKCYDNGGKTFDRYTVIYLSQPTTNGRYAAVGMSKNPFHPQGFGQHTEAIPGSHLGKVIPFESLPQDCQAVVKNDLVE